MGSSGGEDAGHQENDDEYLATVVSIALAQIGISGNDTNQTDLFSSSIGINNSFSSNSRNGVHRHLGPSVQVLLSAVYGLGICGNIAALVMLRRQETQRNKRQTLMLKCLTWNDLIAVAGSAIQMNLQLYLPGSWVLNPYFCGVRVFWRVFGLGSGSVAFTMAVERWIALTKPFVYQTKVTYQRILRSILALWLAVTLLTCLPFLGFGHFYDNSQIGWKKCSRSRFGTTPEDVAYAYIFFTFGLVMCIVIVGCNLGVISALLEMNRRNQHRRRIHKQISVQTNCSVTDAALDLPPIGNNNGPLQRNDTSFVRQISAPMGSSTEDVIGEPFDYNQTHRDSAYSASSSSASAARRRQTLEEIKFARLMVILSIFYVICWIPQLVAIPMGLANPKNQERVFYRIADICMALNFVLDPYIYVLFRGRIGRYFRRFCAIFVRFFRRLDGSRKSLGMRRNGSSYLTNGQLLTNNETELTGNGFAKRPGSEICMNRDQEYVPLKTLLAQTEMTDDVNGESTKENWV